METYLPRHADAALRQALATFPIVVIDGPRGVGKTTTAQRVAASTLELPRDLDRLGDDPGRLLSDLPTPVLIDEWQLAGTDLLWSLKRVVDADPTPGRFILTGSVEPATYGPTYPLTGRSVRVIMRPMTQAELAGHGDARTLLETLLRGWRPPPTATEAAGFDTDRLFVPGFPAARAVGNTSLFFEGYAAVVAQRGGDEGRSASRLLTTMRVLANLESQAVPDQRIWEAADINKATWKAYDDLLARTHLTVASPAFDSNRLKRLTSYPKRYFADSAFTLALAQLDREQVINDRALAGQYFESFALQQMRPIADLTGATLSHLRSSAGEHEIDAVVELNGSVFAFEVKYHSRPKRSDARQLKWLRAQLGDSFAAGFVIHAGGDTFDLGDDIWGIPVDSLATPATDQR